MRKGLLGIFIRIDITKIGRVIFDVRLAPPPHVWDLGFVWWLVRVGGGLAVGGSFVAIVPDRCRAHKQADVPVVKEQALGMLSVVACKSYATKNSPEQFERVICCFCRHPTK